MKEWYQNWNPSEQSIILISVINDILNDYEDQGYKLTLRQLYYQLVSRDFIPNTVASYNRIGNIVSRGRLSGFIDWAMIEDRGRVIVQKSHWETPSQILRAAASGFYLSRWKNQKVYVEVWCEKDAVSNIIQPVCSLWDVTFMANRGYSSQSAMYNAYLRFQAAHFEDKDLHLIYLGDHDPSGIDMSRDITERMELFLGWRELVAEEDIPLNNNRIALNMDQIQKYSPPENPAKMTDSRFDSYAKIYGDKSWELDALEPSVLADLVNDAIVPLIDKDLWDETEDKENEGKDRLQNYVVMMEDEESDNEMVEE